MALTADALLAANAHCARVALALPAIVFA